MADQPLVSPEEVASVLSGGDGPDAAAAVDSGVYSLRRPLTIAPEDRNAMAELLLHPLLEPRVTPAEELEPLYLMGTYAD